MVGVVDFGRVCIYSGVVSNAVTDLEINERLFLPIRTFIVFARIINDVGL